MDAAIGGIVGYYGRSTVIREDDAEQVERVRIGALRAREYAGPRAEQVYDVYGAGHKHTYTHAAAALVDQVDRAMGGGLGEPARVAVESAMATTLRRLGCRTEDPTGWEPTWLETELSDEVVMEAYMKARLRSGVKAKAAGRWAETATGPMRPEAWATGGEEARRSRRGPLLYERTTEGDPEPCTFARRMAAHGIAEWADVTNAATGEWLTPKAAREWYGWKVGSRDETEFRELMKQLRGEGWGEEVARWQAEVRAGRAEGHTEGAAPGGDNDPRK